MLLTHKQVLEWLNKGRNGKNAKVYEWEARVADEANVSVQRFIADYAKKGGKWDTLPHRMAMNRASFEKMIKDEPLLFDAFMMGMEHRISELITKYNELVLMEKEDLDGMSEKAIDRLKQHAESLTVDMNALYNKYGSLIKSKEEMINADTNDFI